MTKTVEQAIRENVQVFKSNILTTSIKQKIKEVIPCWVKGKKYYIGVNEFEQMVKQIMKQHHLDSYSNTRFYCKQVLESMDHEIDLR